MGSKYAAGRLGISAALWLSWLYFSLVLFGLPADHPLRENYFALAGIAAIAFFLLTLDRAFHKGLSLRDQLQVEHPVHLFAIPFLNMTALLFIPVFFIAICICFEKDHYARDLTVLFEAAIWSVAIASAYPLVTTLKCVFKVKNHRPIGDDRLRFAIGLLLTALATAAVLIATRKETGRYALLRAHAMSLGALAWTAFELLLCRRAAFSLQKRRSEVLFWLTQMPEWFRDFLMRTAVGGVWSGLFFVFIIGLVALSDRKFAMLQALLICPFCALLVSLIVAAGLGLADALRKRLPAGMLPSKTPRPVQPVRPAQTAPTASAPPSAPGGKATPGQPGKAAPPPVSPHGGAHQAEELKRIEEELRREVQTAAEAPAQAPEAPPASAAPLVSLEEAEGLLARAAARFVPGGAALGTLSGQRALFEEAEAVMPVLSVLREMPPRAAFLYEPGLPEAELPDRVGDLLAGVVDILRAADMDSAELLWFDMAPEALARGWRALDTWRRISSAQWMFGQALGRLTKHIQSREDCLDWLRAETENAHDKR